MADPVARIQFHSVNSHLPNDIEVTALPPRATYTPSIVQQRSLEPLWRIPLYRLESLNSVQRNWEPIHKPSCLEKIYVITILLFFITFSTMAAIETVKLHRIGYK